MLTSLSGYTSVQSNAFSARKKSRLKKSVVAASVAVLLLCSTLSGCSKNETYNEVDAAFAATAELKSGKLHVVSQVEPSAARIGQTVKSDLTFKENSGAYQYCHTQYDKNDKPVFCEYSDGEKTQQWLIGKGWGGSETSFTKESPHKFVAMLTNAPAEATVEAIVCEEQPTGKQYTITLNPEELNKTVYKDKEMSIIAQEISILVDEKGKLVSYIDRAEIEEASSKQSRKYKLQITISDQNEVAELPQPQLRDYTAAPTDGKVEIAEK